jgi:chromosome segregation ATPase
MRAERLPDLVNHDRSNNKGASEAILTVTFDLENQSEEPATEIQVKVLSSMLAYKSGNTC